MKKCDYNIKILPKLAQIPGMISNNERKFLYFYGNKIFSGIGKIVDLGCWLGATTVALTEGLKNGEKIREKGKIIGSTTYLVG